MPRLPRLPEGLSRDKQGRLRDRQGKFVTDIRAWKALQKRIKSGKFPHVRVGILGPEAVDTHGVSDITLVELAVVHEFGAPSVGIPERSFIRRTFRVKQADIKQMIAKLAKQVYTERGLTLAAALDILGDFAAAEIHKTITEGPGVPPPNSPVTIAKKGSSRPLVDTGQLSNAITWEVRLK